MKVGGRVWAIGTPQAVLQSQDDVLRTRQVLGLCVGRVFPVVGLSSGLIELEVGEVVGEPSCMHSIWIEPDCVEIV